MPRHVVRSRRERIGSSLSGNDGHCRKGTRSRCRSGPLRPPPAERARPRRCHNGTCFSPANCLQNVDNVGACTLVHEKSAIPKHGRKIACQVWTSIF